MKKNILLAFSLMLLSCGSSPEDQIKKELKEYVTLNFDDPNSFKELVSIEAKDTTSLQILLQITEEGLKQGKMTEDWCDSISDTQSKIINEIINNTRHHNLSYKQSTKGGILLEEIYAYTTEDLELTNSYFETKAKIEHFIKGAQYESPLYKYSIKFRKQNKGELTLVEYFAYIDSSTNKITIRPVALKVNEMSSQIINLLHLNQDYTSILSARIQNAKNKSEALRKLKILSEK